MDIHFFLRKVIGTVCLYFYSGAKCLQIGIPIILEGFSLGLEILNFENRNWGGFL
jgi:hypothetical protein